MSIHRIGVAVAVALVLPAAAAAQAGPGVGVAAHVSTLGIGGQAAVALTPMIGIRAGASFIPTDPQFEFSDVDWELDLPSPSFLATVDFYPAGSFRLSAGARFGGDETNILGELTGPVEIGGQTYQPDQIGTLSGLMTTKSVAPYVGVGFGNPAAGGRIGFVLDLGVALQGEPDVALTANGPIRNIPSFQADLAREEAEIQDDASILKLYPVISVGLSVRIL